MWNQTETAKLKGLKKWNKMQSTLETLEAFFFYLLIKYGLTRPQFFKKWIALLIE